MIGWLSGNIRELDPSGAVLLDTGGIGYEVAVSMQTLCQLKQGEQASLSIHTYVREDQITLFGFANTAERTLFRRLTSVSGIGARTALNMMGGMTAQELIQAIEQADDIAIARTPGIGKKTAQRLILELQGKLNSMIDSSAATATTSVVNSNSDVHSALVNLGYKPAQVDLALKHVEGGDFETRFRLALKVLN